MKDKINVAELLKDCPKGMELDCTMFEDVKFIDIDEADKPICIKTGDVYRFLTKFGTWNFDENAKCVIFPKGKTTWEGFVPPCQFKDGDIVFTRTGDDDWVSIFKQFSENKCCTHIDLHMSDNDLFTDTRCLCNIEDIIMQRLATEEEKQLLFDSIKANGYKWNAETKTLEKLIEPKFKVGDRIKLNNSAFIYTITDLLEDRYRTTVDSHDLNEIEFERQDAYQLVSKFDITTLKPFDKVLVRNHEKNEWQPNFFNKYCKEINSFKLIGVCTPTYITNEHFVNYCIPYEGNEHLCGKTDDCDEYFKN